MEAVSFDKQKKKFIIVVIIYPLLLLWLFILKVNNNIDGITLLVRAHSVGVGNYKYQQLPNGGHFLSGITGELELKPASFFESVVLTTIQNTSVDLFEIAGLMVTIAIIMFMFKDSKDGRIFTYKFDRGFLLLILWICMSETIMNMAKMELGRYYIPHITNGKFIADYAPKGVSYYYMVFGLLMFLLIIPKSGRQLQQEQDLTI